MPVKGSMVIIDLQEVKLPAYVSKPEKPSSKSPGVILIHDWMGLGNFTKVVADRYAAQGFVTIAPDLYLGALPHNTEEAQKLSSAVSTQLSKKLLDGTLVYLRALDISKVGITGFCFGGTHAFYETCESRDISAGVIYYATRLPTQDQLQKISAPILIVYGDQDGNISMQEVRQLENTLKVLGKDTKFLIYPGCPHAFFNEESKENYRPDAAKDSWEKTMQFFTSRLISDWQN
jgi:carboxymethylenebutenolidase